MSATAVLIVLTTIPGILWGTIGEYRQEVARFETYDKCLEARDKFEVRTRDARARYFCIDGVVGVGR